MGMNNIMVLNDEAHHCYREKQDPEEEKLREVSVKKLRRIVKQPDYEFQGLK